MLDEGKVLGMMKRQCVARGGRGMWLASTTCGEGKEQKNEKREEDMLRFHAADYGMERMHRW